MAQRAVAAQELEYYRVHFREAIQEEAVVCLECGGLYRFLEPHVRRKHEMSLDEYRERWGYNRTTALISAATHEAWRQRTLRLNLWAKAPPGAIQKALQVSRRWRPSVRLEARLTCGERNRARAAAGWRPPSTKVDDATLGALVAEGLSVPAISERTGLHRSGVRRRVRRLGLTAVAASAGRITQAEFMALREEGLGRGEIAARTGMTVAAVRSRLRRLRERGVRSVPEGITREARDRQIQQLSREGLWPHQIAARLGIAVGTASRVV